MIISNVLFFDYGVPNMPVEYQLLHQCHVVWRTHDGGSTVSNKIDFVTTIGDMYVKRYPI